MMTIVSDSQQIELDEEWMELIEEARRIGYTIDEVRSFIAEAGTMRT